MTLGEQQDAAQRAVNLVPSLLSFANEGRGWLSAAVLVPHDAICGVVTHHYAAQFRDVGFDLHTANVHDIVGPNVAIYVRSLSSSARAKGTTLSRLYIPFKERTFSKKQLEGWEDWFMTAHVQGVNSCKGFFY